MANEKPRKRLALVITELEVGGAERCLVELATRISKDLFEPTVFSLAPRPTEPKDALVKQLDDAGIPIHFINVSRPRQFLTAIRRLRDHFRELEPDVVQTFLFHANVAGTIAAKRAGIPRIVTGIRVADPRRTRSWIERLATKPSNKIVCVSESVATFCKTFSRFPAEKLTVIPNGVDLERFPSETKADLTKFGIEAGRKTIVYVGRLDRQKGLDWLLDAAPQILSELTQYDLLLVGDGPQRDELRVQAERLAILDRVHFAGWQGDVPQILAAADLFVLPSRWEGMPNVVLEAMASGLPIIATRAEGVRELLGSNSQDQIVEFGNTSSLVNAITATSYNETVGHRNRSIATQKYDIESMIQRYEKLYLDLFAAIPEQ